MSQGLRVLVLDGWVNYLTRARLPAPPARQLMDHHFRAY